MKYYQFALFTVFLLFDCNISQIKAIDLVKQKVEIPSDFRKENNGDMYVIAHRGAHNGIPEISLAAYQKAIDLGFDFVEIDVSTTKDGKFTSVHNSTIELYIEVITGESK